MPANYKHLLLLVFITALGAACVPANESVSSRPARTPFVPFAQVTKEELEGTKWLLVSYGPEENHVAVLPGSEAYVAFNNYEDISGFAGCNHFGTHYDIEEGRLITDGIDRTRFDCPQSALDLSHR